MHIKIPLTLPFFPKFCFPREKKLKNLSDHSVENLDADDVQKEFRNLMKIMAMHEVFFISVFSSNNFPVVLPTS